MPHQEHLIYLVSHFKTGAVVKSLADDGCHAPVDVTNALSEVVMDLNKLLKKKK
jgi:hypothetical protein